MKPRINCDGYWVHNSNGPEFDCGYDAPFECGDCIINGGNFSPITHKVFRGNKALYMKENDENLLEIISE